MELEDKQFLIDNINNYDTAKSGFIRNLDLEIFKKYESLYRKYLDPSFVLVLWCGFCRMDMVLRLYTYYEKLPIEEIKNDDVIISFITEEPKKSKRKPKTNG
ncbi:hypothetical protein UFOVP19_37 [uncultured Caudovirales phage]|uniref:Uncharacterized protein n=1 Tax=uncultured Caudovirales phage TaxID=2100421 RepID=A0A6J5KL25_9CAUD|nr:hypothetical protein UFOVP19_37 [uncultured Caudovirales phage]